MTRAGRTALASTLLAAAPSLAEAHAFGELYKLPVPVSMYLYGAASALALSFVMIGYFVATPTEASRNFRTSAWVTLHAPRLAGALRLFSVSLLLLTMASGLVGSNNSYSNFNMTFFWIVILLGYTYCTALFGNSYDLLNPWRACVDAIERYRPGTFSARRSYPTSLAYYPALLLYLALIWMELFGHVQPRSLSVMLIAYTGVTLAGCGWWGARCWFEYCDLFGVFFRVIGRIAPLEWSGHGVRARQPFIGLLDKPCEHVSLLLFILFLLSSTAFDGLHETDLWMSVMRGIARSTPRPMLAAIHFGVPTLALLLSPLLYLGAYVAFLMPVHRLTHSQVPLRQLCLEFGYSLVPIAFVYNVTHYFTVAVSQGHWIFRLMFDPFGYGWNLFGTRGMFHSLILLNPGTVWHLQVGLIVFGHIVSVYLSHLVAQRLFPNRSATITGQLPLLALMVAYTTSGLWILSLPIQAGE